MLAWYFCDFKAIQTSIAKEPYIFVIFQGVGGGGSPTPCPPSGSAHEFDNNQLAGLRDIHVWKCERMDRWTDGPRDAGSVELIIEINV